MKQTKSKLKNTKAEKLNGAGLHVFIAAGGDPKDYKGSKGINKK